MTLSDPNLTSLIPAWDDGVLRPVGKLDVHQRGLKHLAVSVFVVAGDQVLIQKRAAGKYHTPGLWANTCCTHPDWQEATITCANRRLEQELGITGLDPKFRHRVEYRADVGGGLIEHELVDVFVAEAPADLAMDLNPDEVAAAHWISMDDLIADAKNRPDSYTPWMRIYLNDHLDRIFAQSPAA